MRHIFIGLLAAFLAGCAGQQQSSVANSLLPLGTPQVQLTPEMTSATEDAVRAVLKDPDSARFSSLAAFDKGGQINICGLVNAKNSYGGYTGSSPFHAVLKPLQKTEGGTQYVGIGAYTPRRDYVGFKVFYDAAPGCAAVAYIDPESLLPR